MLFGKIDENLFHLDVHTPFTPIVGLAIALSCFDSRFGSEWIDKSINEDLINEIINKYC